MTSSMDPGTDAAVEPDPATAGSRAGTMADAVMLFSDAVLLLLLTQEVRSGKLGPVEFEGEGWCPSMSSVMSMVGGLCVLSSAGCASLMFVAPLLQLGLESEGSGCAGV